MSCEVPYMSYMALYMLSVHIINCNSRSSVHWKLSLQDGMIVEVSADDKSCSSVSLTPLTYSVEDDAVFNILTSTVINNGKWVKEDSCQHLDATQSHSKDDEAKKINDKMKAKEVYEKLDCGESVNYTIYDHLAGVANRHLHPTIPEPDIIDLFDKTGSKKHLDIKQLERKLRKAKKEKLNSTEVFNQIGNYWRIKGDIRQSIECFRKSLWHSANDAESLLNLAVVLFTLQYLEDAIFLAKRSIEAHPPKQSAWLHHFKLGEILKAYGQYHEASLHFRQTLDLNPSFQQASLYLKDMESLPDTTVHICTFFIITILVLAVLLGVLSTVEAHSEDCIGGYKTKRHFNRAMAMHSIKLGMNPRSLRCKKHHS